MEQLTISELKGILDGKKVEIISKNYLAMQIYMSEAIVITDPDIGVGGQITLLNPDTGCKIEIDCDAAIDYIQVSEDMIEITPSNGIHSLRIKIIGDADTETNYVVEQDELCQFIKDKLDKSDKLSELTIDDIDLILDLETDYLREKGIAS